MSGPLADTPSLLWAPLLVAALWFVSLALGRRALLMLRVPLLAFTEGERAFVSLAVGAGLIQFVPYGLGMCGLLRPRAVLLVLGVLSLLLTRDLVHVARSARRMLASLELRRWWGPRSAWVALLLVLLGVAFIAALTLKPFGEDDGYHLSAPRRWLASGTLAYLPTYTTTNASMGFEMLYAIWLSAGSPLGIILIHLSAGVFTFVGVWLASRRLRAEWAGLVTIALLLIANPILDVPRLLEMAYVDLGASWMAMVALLTWLAWRERPEGRLPVVLALAVGFAGSFKSTALAVGIAWVPVLVWEARRQGGQWGNIVKAALGLGLVALLPVVPWMFRSFRATGDPFFPMLASLFPPRDWNPEVAGVFSRFIRYYSWGVAAGEARSEATRQLMVLGTASAVVAGGGVALALVRGAALRGMVAFSSLFVTIAVLVTGLVFRYWLPGLICGALAICTWVAYRWRSGFGREWVPALLLAVALVSQLRSSERRQNLPVALRVATGLSSVDDAYAGDPYWKMWSYINANTPRDSRVLSVAFYTSIGASSHCAFWVDRGCLTTDSHMQTFIRLDEWSAFLKSVTVANVSHVLIFDRQDLAGRYGFTFRAMKNEFSFGRRLVEEYGERLAQFGGLALYRIRPPAGRGLVMGINAD